MPNRNNMSMEFSDFQRKLIFILVYFNTIAVSIPNELMRNGGFDTQLFTIPENETQRLIEKSKNKMPHWKISNGSIQVLSLNYFRPDWTTTSKTVGNYCIHLNSAEGPATIESDPLLNQMKGVVYNLSIDLVGSPKGGDLYKKLQISVIFKRKFFFWLSDEQKFTQYNASNPYDIVKRISWRTKKYSYIGTGRETRIKIASKSGGSNGFLIDNVHVSVHNILDNGSFEELIQDETNVFPEGDVITSPSGMINKWYLESGSIKYIRGRFQPSPDQSGTVLDLNGNEPGILTQNVSTIIEKYYYVSFDYAANPEAKKVVKGYFHIIISRDSGQNSSITNKRIRVLSKGSTQNFIPWKTKTIGFYAQSNVTSIKFRSNIKGEFGPLLDNVLMYQYTTSLSTSSPRTIPTYYYLIIFSTSMELLRLLHIFRV